MDMNTAIIVSFVLKSQNIIGEVVELVYCV